MFIHSYLLSLSEDIHKTYSPAWCFIQWKWFLKIKLELWWHPLTVSSAFFFLSQQMTWRDFVVPFCSSGIQTLPHNAKVHYNYANFLKDSGRHPEAIHHYSTALRSASKTASHICLRSAVAVGPTSAHKRKVAKSCLDDRLNMDFRKLSQRSFTDVWISIRLRLISLNDLTSNHLAN